MLFQRLKLYSEVQPHKVALAFETQIITYEELWALVVTGDRTHNPNSLTSDEVYSSLTSEQTYTSRTSEQAYSSWTSEKVYPSLTPANGSLVELIQTDDAKEELVRWLRALYGKRRPIICHTDLSEARYKALIERYGFISEGAYFTSRQEIPEAASFGVLTSGTTGLPKVLWRSLRSWVDFFEEQNCVFKVNQDSLLFVHGSMSFTGNLNALLSALYAGATTVVGKILRPKHWYEVLKEWHITHLYILPTKLRMLLPCMKETLESLKIIFTGSQLLDYKLVLNLKKQQPQTECILYYGASELNYITYCTFDEWLQEPNTVGYPFKGVTISLDEDHCIEVDTPYGIEGISRPFTVHDRGEFSPTGRLLFKGRADAIINRGGYKLSLPYLESQLLCIEGIADVVVLAVTDELRGEQPIAFIVPENMGLKKEILQHIHHTFLPKECPRQIIWLDAMPLTNASKIDLNALRRLYGEAKEGCNI
ncbi:AMP-binding protein [uncultured Veillonella sp.]|uniref:AMP-binding protein n=1 Tax=uncultured Veillonella sp. TaxID=159268 RepID=UPI00262D8206|nr:AMP-binding protein [uncultured Veillonella sp.]